MRAFRNIAALVLAGVACFDVACFDVASAHIRRHHLAHRTGHRVFAASPGPVMVGSSAGEFGSEFSTGILGASTADPYPGEPLVRGGNGYYGPGFAAPGY